MTKTCVLITGGAGFIGGEFVRQLLARSEYSLVIVDKLTYAARLDGIESALAHPHSAFLQGDIGGPDFVDRLMHDFPIDVVVNFAAESHVDRSISSPLPFLQTNVLGMAQLAEAARSHWSRRRVNGRWLQVSTDEVYGSLEFGQESREEDKLEPSSPYSASKASADLWLDAYRKTFDFPVMLTRCCNNFGPYQYPEKLIPHMVRCAIDGEPLPIYGDGEQIREWIHVADHCRGLIRVLEDGVPGQTYHLGSGVRKTNRELINSLLRHLKDWAQSENFDLPPPILQSVEDRWGHDRLYALNSEKMRKSLGWTCQVPFEDGLKETVDWLARDYLSSHPCNDEPPEDSSIVKAGGLEKSAGSTIMPP